MNIKSSNIKIISFVILTCLLTRLLFINTNVFFFDGDEAIVGLMGIDILHGKLPFYFYGQNYGLAIFEALLISIGIICFKTSMLAIKLPMLVLWVSSIILIALSFSKILKQRYLLVILFISIIIFSPTWLIWSLKARGGYLTSFFFTSLTIFLLIKHRNKIKLYLWLITGMFLILIYEAMPLWIPGVIPIVLYFLFTSKYKAQVLIKSMGMLVLGALAPFIIFTFIKANLYVAWSAPEASFFNRLFDINNLKHLPGLLVANLGGNYFLKTMYEPSNEFFSKLFLLIFFAFTALIFYQLFKNRKVSFSSVLLLSSLFSLLGFFVMPAPRYLLPFFGFALIMMVAAYCEIEKNKLLHNLTVFLSASIIFVGIISLFNLRNFSFVNMSIDKVDKVVVNDTKTMEKLIRLFNQENIKYVYTTNEFLQYQLNYMTENKLLVVGRKDRCRIPENVPEIMNAYEKHSDQFAIIGYNFHYQYSDKIPTIDNKIFYVIRPDKATLQQVGLFSNGK